MINLDKREVCGGWAMEGISVSLPQVPYLFSTPSSGPSPLQRKWSSSLLLGTDKTNSTKTLQAGQTHKEQGLMVNKE